MNLLDKYVDHIGCQSLFIKNNLSITKLRIERWNPFHGSSLQIFRRKALEGRYCVPEVNRVMTRPDGIVRFLQLSQFAGRDIHSVRSVYRH